MLGNARALVCRGCGAEYDLGPRWWGCEACVDGGGHPHWLDVAYDFEAVDVSALTRFGRVWDYAELLPAPPEDRPSRGEGGTPLLAVDGLNRELGLPGLHLKFEAVNPTASFKDRFQAVSMGVAGALGFRRAAMVTTGNAGVAAAAMAAAAGVRLVVVTDPNAPEENVRMMRLFGAVVVVPTGDGPVIDQARKLVEVLVRDHDFYPTSVQGTYAGPGNPYGVEGYKTLAFEVAAQLGRVPDRFCAPVSGGDALYGPYKGFSELAALGAGEGTPAMTACQASGADFLVRSVEEGLDHVTVVSPRTAALSIADPTGSESALVAVRESGGTAWSVTDAEIFDAMALLGRYGLCVEAASATPVAALRRAAQDGRVDRDETIVAVLTGSGMRWPAQVDAAVDGGAPVLLDDVDAILRATEEGE